MEYWLWIEWPDSRFSERRTYSTWLECLLSYLLDTGEKLQLGYMDKAVSDHNIQRFGMVVL